MTEIATKFWIERDSTGALTVCTELDRGDGPESVGLATFHTIKVGALTIFDGPKEADRLIAELTTTAPR